MERNVIEDLVDDCRRSAWECPGKYEFLSNHRDRLERLLKHCQTCSRSVFRVGNYAVIGFKDPDIAGRDGSEILDVLREALLQAFFPYRSLASRAGLGPWLLNYLRTGIGMISDRFDLDSGAPLALAAVIGSDSESGKLFAHILPPMQSLLALLCSERLEEGILRLLMGFDKHYWEYEEGEERVRLQGDLVLQVIREYDYNSLDGAFHNTVSALTVNSVLANVRNLIDSRVKARVLERLDNTRLGGGIVEEAIASAVTEALEDMLGDMVGFLRARRLVPDREVPGDIAVYRVDFDQLFLRDDRQESSLTGYSRLTTSDTLFKPLVQMGRAPKPEALDEDYYEAFTGPLEETDEPKASILYWVSESSQILVDLTYPVNLAYTLLRSTIIDKLWGPTRINWDKFCRDAEGKPHKGILRDVRRIVCDKMESVKISGINIENHKITLHGYRITGTLYAEGILIEEAEELINALIEAGETPLKKWCRPEVVDAISRAFALKTGEELVITSGIVNVTHPEHGKTAISFPRPVLARVTLLNSWEVPGWGEEDEDEEEW